MSAALVVEDRLDRRHWFVNWLSPGPLFADTSQQAIRIYEIFEPRTILLDYDLGGGISSEPFAHYLVAGGFSGRVTIISENPFGMLVLSRILPKAIIKPFPMLMREVERSWQLSDQVGREAVALAKTLANFSSRGCFLRTYFPLIFNKLCVFCGPRSR
jgi:hypothetical protein